MAVGMRLPRYYGECLCKLSTYETLFRGLCEELECTRPTSIGKVRIQDIDLTEGNPSLYQLPEDADRWLSGVEVAQGLNSKIQTLQRMLQNHEDYEAGRANRAPQNSQGRAASVMYAIAAALMKALQSLSAIYTDFKDYAGRTWGSTMRRGKKTAIEVAASSLPHQEAAQWAPAPTPTMSHGALGLRQRTKAKHGMLVKLHTAQHRSPSGKGAMGDYQMAALSRLPAS